MIKDFVIKFQIAILAFLIALSIGFTAGWVIKTKFIDADLVKQLNAIETKSELSIKKSNDIEKSMALSKGKIDIRYITKTKEIIKHVPITSNQGCKLSDGTSINTTLSLGAVRVLNTDSEEPYVQPTDSIESKTVTEVGLRELSEYIILIKKQYEDLAIEHDGLIDYNDYYKTLINQH